MLKRAFRHHPLSYPNTLVPLESFKTNYLSAGFQGVLDQSGKPKSMSMIMKMTDAEILFHFMLGLGDGLIPLYIMRDQASTPRVFSHNTVLDIYC